MEVQLYSAHFDIPVYWSEYTSCKSELVHVFCILLIPLALYILGVISDILVRIYLMHFVAFFAFSAPATLFLFTMIYSDQAYIFDSVFLAHNLYNHFFICFLFNNVQHLISRTKVLLFKIKRNFNTETLLYPILYCTLASLIFFKGIFRCC
jgi:hypothetical protein